MSELVSANEKLKQDAARLSLVYNVFQTFVKLIVAILTGSMSLLSEALHAASDVVSSGISFVSVRASAAPPDEDHPYGHGKIDTFAGLSEAILLVVFASYVLIQSVFRIFHHEALEKIDLGVIVVTVLGIFGFMVGRHVQAIAKATGSMALKSNAQHMFVDFWTTVGVVIALIITKFTHWQLTDPIFAVGLNIWLLYGGWQMSRKAFHELIDAHIDPDELDKIHAILKDEPELYNYHDLRTRHSGSNHWIDFHVVVPGDWTVVRAHELVDRIEQRIEAELAPAVCTIHVDPYEPGKYT